MQIPTRFLALATALLGLPACNDPTGPGGFEFIVQVRAVSQPSAPPAQAPPAQAPGVEAIDIEEAVVVFGGFRLEPEEEPDDFVLEQSVVVPLRLSGDPTLAYAPVVPEGRYRAIEVFLDELEPQVPAEASLIDVFPRLDGMSVLISGNLTRDGVLEPFFYRTALEAGERLQFSRARTFTADATALAVYTVRLDLDQWFEGPGGILLDPNDEADDEAIRTSLVQSMEVVSGGGA